MTPSNAPPLISVIIPTRGRLEQLAACLRSLAGQSLPAGRWEVVVVVDGEAPIDPVQMTALTGCPGLRCFRQEHAGCGAARNTGAAQARGRYLVFTDDDCLFPADWLAGYEQVFLRSGDCLVSGRPVNWLRSNPYSEATQELISYMLARFNTAPDRARLAIGCNFGASAAGFRELGGFDKHYFRTTAEDRDFCDRWLASGRQMVYVEGIEAFHAHRLTFRSFLRQHFHYGRGAVVLHRMRAARAERLVRLEPARFYLGLFLWPWTARHGAAALRLALLFAASQVAHTAGYLRELPRRPAL
jgi:GT2 family glycosyltransferase